MDDGTFNISVPAPYRDNEVILLVKIQGPIIALAHRVIDLKRNAEGPHDVRIRLLNEDDEEILSGDGKVNFPEPPAGVLEVEAGAVLAFDVPFQKPGKYRFEINVDSEVQTAVPIAVSQGPSPSQGPPGQHRTPPHNE